MVWAYGVTTVPKRRLTTFSRTMKSLAAAGFGNPRVFLDGGSPYEAGEYLSEYDGRCSGVTSWHPPVHVAPAWYLALTELYVRESSADRYAVFQDDVLSVGNLKAYLDACPYPKEGYWNLITYPGNEKEWREKHGGKVGWFRSNQLGHGAQGLVFNREAVFALLSSSYMVRRFPDATTNPGNFGDLPRGKRSVDGGIVTAMSNAGFEEYCHGPTLLYHTGEESSFGNRKQPDTPGFLGEGYDALQFLGKSG